MTADVEDEFVVAQANEPLDESGRFVHARVVGRYRDEFVGLLHPKVDLYWTSPENGCFCCYCNDSVP